MLWAYASVLLLLLVGYLALGGFIFSTLEGPAEIQVRNATRDLFNKFKNNKSCISHEELDEFINIILLGAGHGLLVNQRKHNDSTNWSLVDDPRSNWDLVGSVYFSLTVITTIGYGNVAPRTVAGRLLCVLYGFLGIPLLAFAVGIGGESVRKQILRLINHICGQQTRRLPLTGRFILVVFIYIILFVFLSAVPFALMENWSYVDAIYFTFATLSTAGFGDFEPAIRQDEAFNTTYRMLFCVWVVLAMFGLAFVIGFLRDIIRPPPPTPKQKKKLKRRGTGIDLQCIIPGTQLCLPRRYDNNTADDNSANTSVSNEDHRHI